MTNWIKVKKNRSNSGRQPRTTFAVTRSKTNFRTAAKLIVPIAHVTDPQADAYMDKAGNMLRFIMVDDGEYVVQKGKGNGHTQAISLPAEATRKIPRGLTEAKVEVDAEEGALTIDLRQFKAAVAAQAEEYAAQDAEMEAELAAIAAGEPIPTPKKAPAKKTPAKKTPAKKAPAKKAPAKPADTPAEPAQEQPSATPATEAPSTAESNGDDLL